jgi:ubiquinone/menaquinone biosynthesis C-methylase UbiE
MAEIQQQEATSNQVYDKFAATYGYDLSSSLPSRLKYELTVKYLKPEYSVLDVGCANGIHMQALAKYCSKIQGIDINEKMLSLAREKFGLQDIANAEVFQQSAAALDFHDESFDLVYSFSTLLLVPDIKRAIEELARVLKPGGIGILDVTGRYNLSRIYWGRYYKKHGHFGVNSFGYAQLTGFLKKTGLDILESHALGFTDQWKYLPLMGKLGFLEKFFHGAEARDLDYRVSNLPLLFPLANRWYLVCRKAERPGTK